MATNRFFHFSNRDANFSTSTDRASIENSSEEENSWVSPPLRFDCKDGNVQESGSDAHWNLSPSIIACSKSNLKDRDGDFASSPFIEEKN